MNINLSLGYDFGPKSGRVLCVDLDGTLLRSDMLYESFWSALAQDWRSILGATRALLRGKAQLKRYLADASDISVATLPYDKVVLSYIQEWRDQGGSVVLVTASDQTLATAISDHLGLFDEVYGSNGTTNLKGVTKAQFLQDRFGRGHYSYMGDAVDDLSVWKGSDHVVTVNTKPTLRQKVEEFAENVEHLQSIPWPPQAVLTALRPHQWIKNLLVFLPMLTSHQIGLATLGICVLCFVAFSLVASAVYLVNDMLDLSADRAHPRKCRRPLAAGTLRISHGTGMAVGLLGVGIALSGMLGASFLLVMLTYFCLTTAYSMHFKRQIVVDICVLAGLYTLRIVAGAVALGIDLSVWLLAFSMFFFLALAAVKRQAELVDSAFRGKLMTTGRGYHVEDLPIVAMIAISAGYVSVLVMALYVNSPDVMALYSHPQTLWGVCAILMFWVSRTVMIAHRGGMHDDPVVFAAKDGVSRASFLMIVGFVVAGTLP